jgi:hypothetical protein
MERVISRQWLDLAMRQTPMAEGTGGGIPAPNAQDCRDFRTLSSGCQVRSLPSVIFRSLTPCRGARSQTPYLRTCDHASVRQNQTPCCRAKSGDVDFAGAASQSLCCDIGLAGRPCFSVVANRASLAPKGGPNHAPWDGGHWGRGIGASARQRNARATQSCAPDCGLAHLSASAAKNDPEQFLAASVSRPDSDYAIRASARWASPIIPYLHLTRQDQARGPNEKPRARQGWRPKRQYSRATFKSPSRRSCRRPSRPVWSTTTRQSNPSPLDHRRAHRQPPRSQAA